MKHIEPILGKYSLQDLPLVMPIMSLGERFKALEQFKKDFRGRVYVRIREGLLGEEIADEIKPFVRPYLATLKDGDPKDGVKCVRILMRERYERVGSRGATRPFSDYARYEPGKIYDLDSRDAIIILNDDGARFVFEEVDDEEAEELLDEERASRVAARRKARKTQKKIQEADSPPAPV